MSTAREAINKKINEGLEEYIDYEKPDHKNSELKEIEKPSHSKFPDKMKVYDASAPSYENNLDKSSNILHIEFFFYYKLQKYMAGLYDRIGSGGKIPFNMGVSKENGQVIYLKFGRKKEEEEEEEERQQQKQQEDEKEQKDELQ
jgi:hypothetical protein